MQYANLADIVNGFEVARQWRFVRKGGSNVWSLIGLDENGQVVYELENLHYKQCKALSDDVREDAEIVEIVAPTQLIHRDTIVQMLNACLFHLSNGSQGNCMQSRDDTMSALQGLLQDVTVGR